MALTWVTPPGSLANFLIGSPSEVYILATDDTNPGIHLTYSVISGELPAGMTMTAQGHITGTPEYSTASNNQFTTLPYAFIVRALDDQGNKVDGSFTITITNTFTQNFYWVTPPGTLGTVPNGQFYSLQLKAVDVHNRAVTYSFLSGELPPGMQVLSTGSLQGVPTLITATKVNASQNFRFTIRATNANGNISDQAFDISVTNVFGPIIKPSSSNATEPYFLGASFDGQYYSLQLSVNELNPNAVITWTITDGELPKGLTLDSNGLISGYIQPLELIGEWGPANYDSYTTDPESGAVKDRSAYDRGPYQFNQVNQNLSRTFTVEAYDGANYDVQTYNITVLSRSGFTADSTITVDNNTIPVSANDVYSPILLNTAKNLPVARQDSYYAYKFDGVDFQGDTITYNISNVEGTYDSFMSGSDEGFDYAPFDSYTGGRGRSNLPGLILDSQSGWLYGKVGPQATSIQNYTFGVYVSKTRGLDDQHHPKEYSSVPIFFTLSVLGDVNNVVKWITPTNLGTIYNGTISELHLEAKSVVNKPLTYRLYDGAGVPCHLPQGLKLLPSGEISGRVSFELFNVDDYTTTFDKNKMMFDRKYDFTVIAETVDGTAESIQIFSLVVTEADQAPYENLYLQAMPDLDQRKIYNSVINDPEIFSPALIYRPTDPNFGLCKNIKTLFLSGLSASSMDEYETAMIHNHYTKTYNFGEIKTAVVLDDNYNVKYEVVYIDLTEPNETVDGRSTPLEIDLTGSVVTTPTGSKTVYPNTSINMIERLAAGLGFEDQSSLPPWMTSNQVDPTNTGKFKTPLGFTKAVVMAYTKPGAANLIAYRLKNTGINFNRIEFMVNRYQLDNYYSTYYQPSTGTYIRTKETTFDNLAVNNIGTIVAQVEYGVTVPFSEINGRPFDYINSQGGIDGSQSWRNGDTLIFIKQENYRENLPYAGWINYTNAYIGDNVTTNVKEGYGSTPYDAYYIVPGFGEKSQNLASATVIATRATASNNYLTLESTDGLIVGTGINFTGIMFAGLVEGTTYYIASIVDNKYITLSTTGDLRNIVALTNSSGEMIGKNCVNKRGGVWQINIIDGVVNLQFLKEVDVNQRIRVLKGRTYSGAIVYYSLNLSPGQSVPYYQVYHLQPTSKVTKTTFNDSTTRFFNYRDQYYTPGSEDKYVEFPQIGVFN